MDCSIQIKAKWMGLSIIHFKGSQVGISQLWCISVLEDCFYLKQTVKTLMKCRFMLRFIWVFTFRGRRRLFESGTAMEWHRRSLIVERISTMYNINTGKRTSNYVLFNWWIVECSIIFFRSFSDNWGPLYCIITLIKNTQMHCSLQTSTVINIGVSFLILFL